MITADKSLLQIARERRYILIAILSVVIVVVMGVGMLIPMVQETLTANEGLDQQKAQLEKLRGKVDFLETFQAGDYQTLSARVRSILPSSKPFLPLLFSLEKLSSEHNVVFAGLDVSPGVVASESAEPKPDEAIDTLASLDLELKVYGTSENLNLFMDRMNTIAPALDVRTFTLTPKQFLAQGQQSSIEPGKEIYEANIKVIALYAPLLVKIEKLSQLPNLSSEENAYARTLGSYTIFTQETLSFPQNGQPPKEDLFAP